MELLQFLRRFLLQDLARIDVWIQQETLHAESRRGQQIQASRAAQRPWWVHHDDGRPIRLHVANCFFISRHDGGHACTRQQAIEALAAGAEPCPGCRPDSDLGTD
ncbi:DUF6233 domain-containing protein [Streptomyces fuscigenes]|uniref:DUF6233 domain-containing protein n=1 Tax=Streptomyces fuscigenes TaxID=1528880 RepID=UPI001F2E4641|nr:DUF6233 domain-containing protein [Streptomyces fuscigenes]MCF3960458.1 DUF6233 domain-containing protein [Streptomyces fuscigenes]